jgi:acyl transferase domain-containing protein/acyl carrier protein
MSDLPAEAFVNEIAVIGMSGRFPGARNLDEFWRNLREGRECITFFSDEELREAGVAPALVDNRDYVKAKAVLEDIELFDAAFFGINPREAEIIDPQQRLFLECSWEAFENAGYDPENFDGLIGVYAGVTGSSYMLNNLLPNQELVETMGNYQIGIGNRQDQLPTRVSYKLNLRGPSVAVQTACSTSLVAVVCACQALLGYQCDIALAGGVSISIPQKEGYLYREGKIGSPDGHCRAFDAKARGTVNGEGIGIVILKRLADALADGDHIRAVIKGFAINNDGSQRVGYTAPSVDGQADVVAMAHALAGVKADSISYVEAHGTGTSLGDPIELAALTKAFRAGTEKNGFCAIGSVKTNIGHLDAAAGIAGLIKTVLALENKQLPPSLHFEAPNPEIDFENSPFYVNTALCEWQAAGSLRRAGVSSFGIGGTNAHVVLEQAPFQKASAAGRPWQLLVLSAKTETALETATRNLAAHLANYPGIDLADAAYTLTTGRRRFANRRFVVGREVDDALKTIASRDPQHMFTAVDKAEDRPVVFMFSGQGTQYVNMALELYRAEPLFREKLDRCAEIFKVHLGTDLRDVLFADADRIDAARQRLNQTSMAQPALFAIEYALAGLLDHWGIRPRAMIGHSIGEYVAACLAGVFSLEDALSLVAVRGRLIQELPGGAMLTVALPEEQVRPLLGSQLSLAAVNGPSRCTISGPEANVAALENELVSKEISCSRLHVSHAFHSAMVEPVLPQFIKQLERIRLKPPQMKYISNVTGTWITAAEATDPAYWARHLRQTVRFADGIAELMKIPDAILLEVGPGRTLGRLAMQQAAGAGSRYALSALRHPKEPGSDVAFLLNTLGRMWLAGARIDWARFYRNEKRHRIPLPAYPFEHQRYWIEPQKTGGRQESRQHLAQTRSEMADWFYLPSWRRTTPLQPNAIEILKAKKRSWLIFSDELGVGAAAAKYLQQAGQQVVRVAAGEKFIKLDQGSYTVNPRSPHDYEELLKELGSLNKGPDRILHFWCLTPDRRRRMGLEHVEKYQFLGFYSLLFIAQGLGKRGGDNSIRISAFANHMQNVTGGELVCPEKATLSAACKIIPQEYQNIKCRCVDLSISGSIRGSAGKLVDQIMDEAVNRSPDAVVAYRGAYRWAETFEPVRLAQTAGPTARLKEGGTYLITGGLGGIGFSLAEHLAGSLKAKLILIGRSSFPAKVEWKQWLENHDAQDGTSRKISKMLELEKLGAEFLVFSADVADPAQMQTVVSESVAGFGRINGVVHAAGIIDHGGMIQKRSLKTTAEVLAPKVAGTIVLDTVLADADLDFFVCCSSMSTVIYKSVFAQVGYCAANEFLDAFAYRRSSRNGCLTVTINWCDWREVGMSVRAMDYFSKTYNCQIESPTAISPAQGVDIFLRILTSEHPRVAVFPQDLRSAIEQAKPFLSGIAHRWGAAQASHARPDLATAYSAPRNDLEQKIAGIWQEMMGIKDIGIFDNYFDLGGDSLLAGQLVHRIRERFEVEVPLDKFFESATVAALADRVGSILWLKQNRLKASQGAQEEYGEI